MTQVRILLTVAASLLAVPVQADFEPVSMAYEVAGKHFTAPATPNGGLTLRRCGDCTPQTIRVTETTLYSFDGQQMILDRFRDALAAAPRNHVMLAVMHHLESDTVLRVSAIVRRDVD